MAHPITPSTILIVINVLIGLVGTMLMHKTANTVSSSTLRSMFTGASIAILLTSIANVGLILYVYNIHTYTTTIYTQFFAVAQFLGYISLVYTIAAQEQFRKEFSF